ncbi:MAG TPA: hypothetical protein ENN80_03825, partial [Candidatus Hydrogenedentes bacterium]|nr:hypothetical protein [Candidatus Hydrogenedentota bacterium]
MFVLQGNTPCVWHDSMSCGRNGTRGACGISRPEQSVGSVRHPCLFGSSPHPHGVCDNRIGLPTNRSMTMSYLPDSVQRLTDIAEGFIRAKILFVANDAEVFALLETPRTAEEVARAVGWSPRGTRMLLDALVALELATSSNGRYRNAPIASECLVPGAPYYQGDIMRHRHNGWQNWSRLTEALVAGTGLPSERTPE